MDARRPQLSLSLDSTANGRLGHSPLASPMIVLKSPPTPPLMPDSSSCDSISSCASSDSRPTDEQPVRPAEAVPSWKTRGASLVLSSSWSAKENSDETFETPPHTPNCNPETGYFNFGPHPATAATGAGRGMRRQLLTRQSSISSATSSVEDEEADHNDWTEEEKQVLQQTFDSYVESAATTEAPLSKVGPPPPNFTQIVAKAVVRQPAPKSRPSRGLSSDDHTPTDSPATLGPEAAEIQKWRHGLKSTRAQILSLVKERQHSAVDATPRPGLEDTPRGGPSAAPLARANSMDFLPMTMPGPRVATAAKLSAKLQQGTGAQDAYVAPPIAGAHNPILRRPMFASMQRTNSLSSVQGSPSQPARPSASVTPQSSSYKRKPSSAAAAAFSAFHLAPNPTSTAMARSGSDCGPSVDPLDHLPNAIGSYSSPEVPRLSSVTGSPTPVPTAGGEKVRRSSVFDLPPRKPSGAGLGLEAAFEGASAARKRFASGSTAPVALKNSGRRSTSPESKSAATTAARVSKSLFPAFVVTEHEDDELAPPTRSLKSLSLHPTVAPERPAREASPDKDEAVKRTELKHSPIFGNWGGFSQN